MEFEELKDSFKTDPYTYHLTLHIRMNAKREISLKGQLDEAACTQIDTKAYRKKQTVIKSLLDALPIKGQAKGHAKKFFIDHSGG